MKTTRHDSFAAYVLPSVLAFALSGLYTIVDGFFIGQSLGDLGLAVGVENRPFGERNLTLDVLVHHGACGVPALFGFSAHPREVAQHLGGLFVEDLLLEGE